MGVARTARRRRKQAAMGYRHLAKHQRPIYRKRDTATLDKKAAKAALVRKRMAAKGMKVT